MEEMKGLPGRSVDKVVRNRSVVFIQRARELYIKRVPNT
jgi:hypothetical protein